MRLRKACTGGDRRETKLRRFLSAHATAWGFRATAVS
jgi:hypothetical protein